MSNRKNKNSSTDTNVITSIVMQADVLQAVKVRKAQSRIELAEVKSVTIAEGGWGRMASDFSSSQLKKHAQPEDAIIITGFESSAVVYQRFQVPYSGSSELRQMVKMQAEAHLPLRAEQMELAWRCGQRNGSLVDVTVAAGRTERLNQYLYDLGRIKPKQIILDSEAIIEVWKRCFGGNNDEAVIVSIGKNNTRLCAAGDGQLLNAATIDIGTEDFGTTESTWSNGEIADRFAQDTCSAISVFGYSRLQDVPVILLSDGQPMFEQTVEALKAAGLNARLAKAETERFQIAEELSGTDMKSLIYEYRVAIGLALLGFDITGERFDIFAELYSPEVKSHRLRLRHNLKAGIVIAAMMIILLTAVWYFVDAARLNAIEKSFAGTGDEQSGQVMLEKQKLIKTVAKERPDLLNLLSIINSEEAKGITLDSFEFKKGRPASIKGSAGNSEQLYKYQEVLQNTKGISNVKIQSTSKGDKGKKLNFTVTFDYKLFTKRTGNLLNR